jgi:hypothetical protein
MRVVEQGGVTRLRCLVRDALLQFAVVRINDVVEEILL